MCLQEPRISDVQIILYVLSILSFDEILPSCYIEWLYNVMGLEYDKEENVQTVPQSVLDMEVSVAYQQVLEDYDKEDLANVGTPGMTLEKSLEKFNVGDLHISSLIDLGAIKIHWTEDINRHLQLLSNQGEYDLLVYWFDFSGLSLVDWESEQMFFSV